MRWKAFIELFLYPLIQNSYIKSLFVSSKSDFIQLQNLIDIKYILNQTVHREQIIWNFFHMFISNKTQHLSRRVQFEQKAAKLDYSFHLDKFSLVYKYSQIQIFNNWVAPSSYC